MMITRRTMLGLMAGASVLAVDPGLRFALPPPSALISTAPPLTPR